MPTEIAATYQEAHSVLNISANASAALSRRCLQQVLRQAGSVKPGDLAKEIDQVIASGDLPQALSDDLDAVRHVGNFAAHPIKSQHTGEIMPAEPAEAEWNLEVLESLFEVYYVQPARRAERRSSLNAKLAEAGKPPLGTP